MKNLGTGIDTNLNKRKTPLDIYENEAVDNK